MFNGNDTVMLDRDITVMLGPDPSICRVGGNGRVGAAHAVSDPRARPHRR
jgi:hypothetical protein